MQHESPGEKLQSIMNILQSVILPMMPMFQQQGIGLNIESLMKLIAKYGHIDELNDILTFMDPTDIAGSENGPVGEPPRQAPVTHRTTERISRSAPTRSAQDSQFQQALVSGSNQNGPGSVISPVG